MIPVWQDISGPNGNCMQAAVASLLELGLEDVPNFKLAGRGALRDMIEFMKSRGYSFVRLIRPRHDLRSVSNDIGVGGYFFAVVRSLVNDGGHHAVVIDSNCCIVHPVNPKYDGIVSFEMRSEDEVNGITYVFVFNPTRPEDTDESLRRARMTRKNTVRAASFRV